MESSSVGTGNLARCASSAGSISPERTGKFDRPMCEWKSSKYDGGRLALWQPPAPDMVTDTDDTVRVGQHTGHITSETSTSCLMDVKAEPAYLQLDVNAADVDSGRNITARSPLTGFPIPSSTPDQPECHSVSAPPKSSGR